MNKNSKPELATDAKNFMELRKRFFKTRQHAATFIGCSVSSVEKWEWAERPIPQYAWKPMLRLQVKRLGSRHH